MPRQCLPLVPSAVFGIPVWSPLHVPARVNCVRTNCPGPYHGDWAIDFVNTDRSTRDPLYAVAPGIVHIEARTGNNTCAMSSGTSCRPTRTPILAEAQHLYAELD